MPWSHRRKEAKLEAKAKKMSFSKRASQMVLDFCKETSLHGKSQTKKALILHKQQQKHHNKN